MKKYTSAIKAIFLGGLLTVCLIDADYRKEFVTGFTNQLFVERICRAGSQRKTSKRAGDKKGK